MELRKASIYIKQSLYLQKRVYNDAYQPGEIN